jgi:hypothetical protein
MKQNYVWTQAIENHVVSGDMAGAAGVVPTIQPLTHLQLPFQM